MATALQSVLIGDRTISLTRGQVSIVDAADYDGLARWKWTAAWSKCTKTFYAQRIRSVDGRQVTVRMHRVILGLGLKDGFEGDHINGDTLDNRRSNLRVATRSQNSKNRKLNSTNKSGFKGVYQFSPGVWRALIRANGKRRHLGLFPTPELAHAAYVSAAKDVHGEFARTA